LTDDAIYGSVNQVFRRFDLLIEKIIIKKIYYSKSDLYDALQIDTGKMSRIRKGKTDIDHKVLFHLKSNVSDVNLNWLFTGQGDMFQHTEERTYGGGVSDVIAKLVKPVKNDPPGTESVLTAILENQRAIKILIDKI